MAASVTGLSPPDVGDGAHDLKGGLGLGLIALLRVVVSVGILDTRGEN